MVKRFASTSYSPVRPELAGELAPLAALCGVTDRAALAVAVAALGPTREQGVLQHGPQVAAHLQQLGLREKQLQRLLLCCPMLFSWPAEQRPAMLFGQLMGRLGLTAAEAARCFEQHQAIAKTPSFEPAIDALAELFAAAAREEAGSAGGGSAEAAFSGAERQAGEWQLGQLLRDVPSAVQLLCLGAGTLRERQAALRKRYGLSAQQLLLAVQRNKAALGRHPSSLTAKERVLEEELGVSGRRLVSAMLIGAASRAISCSVDTLRQRARALAEVRPAVWALLCLAACLRTAA